MREVHSQHEASDRERCREFKDRREGSVIFYTIHSMQHIQAGEYSEGVGIVKLCNDQEILHFRGFRFLFLRLPGRTCVSPTSPDRYPMITSGEGRSVGEFIH